jgi:hypothetical protein
MPPRTSAVHSIWEESTHDRVLSPVQETRIAFVIYCVVPEALADELYPKLEGYYEDDPNVTVIVDRRKKERRLPGSTGGGQREVRDRRRARITGDFAPFPSRVE